MVVPEIAGSVRESPDSTHARLLDWIGVSTNLLLAWFGGVAGTTADDGANVWVLAVPTGLYMLAVLGYTVFIVRGGRYRVPND
jgi:hypothetical protein